MWGRPKRESVVNKTLREQLVRSHQEKSFDMVDNGINRSTRATARGLRQPETQAGAAPMAPVAPLLVRAPLQEIAKNVTPVDRPAQQASVIAPVRAQVGGACAKGSSELIDRWR